MSNLLIASGTVLGGEFVVERALASGGMGSVFVARQQSTNKLRAVKLLSPDFIADAKSREGFLREAQVGSVIPSDHVVEVIAAGVDQATGLPWIAMELLNGQDLRHYIERNGPAHPELAAKILRELFHAVSAAHAAGIVHRDLKPDNVFLHQSRQVGGQLTTKILDFGIAKIVSAAATSNSTRSIGTPGWMAPEQCSAGKVGAGADVWALALIAFYLYTGQGYWLALRDENASLVAVLKEVVLDPLPKPSARAAEFGLGHLLPAWFDSWAESCLVRDPPARLPDAQTAWQSLSRCIDTTIASPTIPQAPATLLESGSIPIPTQKQTTPINPSPGVLVLPQASAVSGPPSEARSPRTVSDSGTISQQPVWAPAPTVTGDATAHTIVTKSRAKLWIALGAFGAVGALGLAAIVVWAVGINGERSKGVATPQLPSASGHVTSAASSAIPNPEMVQIPAGGYDIAKGISGIVAAFWLDRSEVTIADWDKCAAASACAGVVDSIDLPDLKPDQLRYWSGFCNHTDRQQRARHPINCVSRSQAESYCRFSGKRLPTQQEWLFAAYRAGSTSARRFPWGDAELSATRLNACGVECAGRIGTADKAAAPIMPGFDDGSRSTSAVGSYPEGNTPLGLQDMAGNVWEWTSTQGETPSDATIVGGGWYDRDPATFSLPSAKSLGTALRHSAVGFRCAK